MSVTIDANLLVYAGDPTSRFHARAAEVLRRRLEEPGLVHLFWPVLLAYLRVATHPKLSSSPVPLLTAEANVGALLDRPNVRVSGEPDGFWPVLRKEMLDGQVRGKLVHDAHLVALMRAHGVRDIITHDRDFRRFDGVRVIDPFADE